MYETFYGLSDTPFRLSPDHRFFFGSQSHNKAMAYLRYGLHQGEGFIVITGDIGTGKSTLVSQLFSELDTRRVLPAKIATTNVEADDAVRLIISAFRLSPPSTDKAALLRHFESFLVDQHKASRRVLLVVDEAQNLPMRTIEELRMLSNFAVGGQSLFQSFLLGQPQFKTLLADPGLEQLRQRVIASYHLEPMSFEETRHYIEHRLRTAGWRGDPALFDETFAAIHVATNGVPRRINTLCNRLMLYGALEERHELDADAVADVLADLQGEVAETVSPPAPEPPPLPSGPSAPTLLIAPPEPGPRVSGGSGNGASLDASAAARGNGTGRGDLEVRVDALERRLDELELVMRQVLQTALGYLATARIGRHPTAPEPDDDAKR